MLIRQVHQKSVLFVTKNQPNVCNGCHDVSMMSINLNDLDILRICRVDYCCNINGISKSEALNLLQIDEFNCYKNPIF